MKKRVLKELAICLPIDIAIAGLTYWLTNRLDLTIIVAALVLGGATLSAFGTSRITNRNNKK